MVDAAVNPHLSPNRHQNPKIPHQPHCKPPKQRGQFVILLGVLSVFSVPGASRVAGGVLPTAPILMGFEEKQSKHAVTASTSFDVYQHC